MSEPAFHKSGKLEDFEEIILPHLNAAYNLARWLLRNEQDAQDVVQEASLRAYRFFDGYKGGDAKAWLLTIVRNTSLTWRRRAKRDASNVLFDEVVHGAPADAPNAEERMVDADKTTALRNCIEALPTEYREVLILREFEEMSYKRIAETVGLPVGTVMSRLSRARQRLEACIGGRRAGAEK
ncbi:MAG TPA: sigma-70 family RNA polymerase sigma factor [Bryobacteraceae bacterium]|nr:sigma-70 family RNA polymerase sigma factor [Bryobacteraceae bacterium]